ncbi:MAG TPA: heterodisulfide reductase-related iron-sulfur binding cluster [Nocardioidaceae bacterium]|nr:heterodisulfide reductase-related iron-sulfur binding cluster [Nocardioidaceae bacterium]
MTAGNGPGADVFAPPPGERAFDDQHPPRQDLLDDCVHCGFCLTTCPTYVLWGEEMDSPRGRIHLVEQGAHGAPMSDSLVTHIDRCLGCMACVTSCPSGVQYDHILEPTRAQIERRYERDPGDRLLREAIFAMFPYPRRLRALRLPLLAYQRSGLQRLLRRSGVLQRLSPTLATMEAVAPPVQHARPAPSFVPAQGARRAVVGMLTGCVQREFFPHVNAATSRVLAAEGCDVVIPPTQQCCGALSMHTGRRAEAQRFARALVDAFEGSGVEYAVVNSAGCGSSMKEYAELLQDDPAYADRAAAFADRVRDVTEVLVELGPVAPRHPVPLAVAYHDACHLAHAQGVRTPPRELLDQIPGLELREINEAAVCCGSAGVWNLLNPEPANELGDRKAGNVLRTGADLLVTANPGCLLQISSALRRADKQVPTAHTVQVLDASIAGRGPESLLPA